MNSNSSFIVIASSLSNIKSVFDWLEEGLFKLINNKEKHNVLSLIIQESLVNAIVHGNKKDNKKHVTLSYILNKSDVCIKVEDEGEGIPTLDQSKDSEHIKEDDLLKDSGRGIILIKHFCKEVIFDKNSVKLTVEL